MTPSRREGFVHSGRRSGTACAPSRAIILRQSAAQDLGEDDRVIVLGVPGGVDEGERAVARPPPKLGEPWAFATKLLDVAAAKLLEATGLVPEPLPEWRTRGATPDPTHRVWPALARPHEARGGRSRPGSRPWMPQVRRRASVGCPLRFLSGRCRRGRCRRGRAVLGAPDTSSCIALP
jgi:hypothetical protein